MSPRAFSAYSAYLAYWIILTDAPLVSTWSAGVRSWLIPLMIHNGYQWLRIVGAMWFLPGWWTQVQGDERWISSAGTTVVSQTARSGRWRGAVTENAKWPWKWQHNAAADPASTASPIVISTINYGFVVSTTIPSNISTIQPHHYLVGGFKHVFLFQIVLTNCWLINWINWYNSPTRLWIIWIPHPFIMDHCKPLMAAIIGNCYPVNAMNHYFSL